MPTLNSSLVFKAIKILYYVGQCSILLPILIGIQRRHFLSQSLRIILYCCLMWMILMALGEYGTRVWHYNAAVWHLVDLLEVWFIGWAYYYVLRFRFRRHFLLIGILYSAFALFDSFVLNELWYAIQHKLSSGNTYTMVIKNLIVMILVLLHFEQNLRDLRNITLERDPMFVVSVALIVFFASTVVLYLIRLSITDRAELMMTLPVSSMLNILLHGVLARAFWLAGRQQKPMFPLATAPEI